MTEVWLFLVSDFDCVPEQPRHVYGVWISVFGFVSCFRFCYVAVSSTILTSSRGSRSRVSGVAPDRCVVFESSHFGSFFNIIEVFRRNYSV